MPRKIRQLRKDLIDAGFRIKKGRGKGDHQVYGHPDFPSQSVTLDGQPGDDAHAYQEREVQRSIENVRTLREHE
jgi:predicted RNA binding protein YcfA (HicA-like mRNA interferase family)